MMPPLSSSSSSIKPKRQNLNRSNSYSNIFSSTSSCCDHSPSATLDLIILILVLFSCAFLIFSSLSHLFHALTLFLPSFFISPLHYFYVSLLILGLALLLILKSSRICSRKCRSPKCKGLKKAVEFDVKIQGEECLKDKGKEWKEIEDLPWKGGQYGKNPDYELLRAELRKMAPVNGRAVLLFRLRCGCPVAKLEAWGPKKGRLKNKR